MRCLSMICVDETTSQVSSQQLRADMGQLIEERTRIGPWRSTAGLRPTSEGARVRPRRGGTLSVLDSPFIESNEVIGGDTRDCREKAMAITSALAWAEVERIPVEGGPSRADAR